MCKAGFMKRCDNCGNEFGTRQPQCPVCGGALGKADNTGEIAAFMLLFGLL